MRAVRARVVALVVLAVALTGLLPGAGVRPTAAAWADTTRDRARITVASDACTATGVYTGQASSALLAGTVQGAAVGAPATLVPVATGERTDASSPSRAVVTPAAAADALLSGVALTPASSWSQTAGTTGTGTSSATAGGAPAVGRVDVSGILTRSPDRTAALPGLSGIGLDVGAVSSSSALNGCAAAWGDSGTLTRSSTVTSLGLRFSDSAVTSALTGLSARGTSTAGSLTGLATAPATGNAVTKALTDGLLGAIGTAPVGDVLGTPSATASIAVGPTPILLTALGTSVSGGTTLDVGSGAVTAAVPVPAGQDADALSSARITAIAVDTGAALRKRATALTDAEAGARDSATMTVQTSVDLLTVLGVKVSTISVNATAPVSTWTSGAGVNLQAKVQLLGAPLATVDAGITSRLTSTLLPLVQNALATSFTAPATALIAADTAAAGALVDSATSAVGTDLAALPSLLVVTTDQRGTAAADSWTGGVAAGSGGVTAVRVRVKDSAGTRADLFIGDTAVGPNRGAFR